MKRLTLIIFLMLIPILLISAEDITKEQALKFWSTLNEDERAEVVIEYIENRNADPVIEYPSWLWIVTGRTVTVFPNKDLYNLQVGNLFYSISYDPITLENVIPKYKFPFVVSGLSFLAGLLVGILAE